MHYSARSPARRESASSLLALWLLLICPLALTAADLGHPRLYFSAQELPQLRQLRAKGIHAKIWKNLAESADWCLTQKPRTNWIAPVTPDPRYENLYDRFYAIMGDLAITEHLAFAYALSGDARYGDGARQWVLSSCRAWKREADGKPDSGKAYAVSRLLKGVAVGYDAAYDRFSEAERSEIRSTLAQIGRKYFEEWFKTPTISGPDYHTHHAIVEWGSFGVAALALLGEEPEAKEWLAATTKKFEEHLLPRGLAEDGAQIEGATFWASTMHYRLFFMDALRRVTGRDLFREFEKQMSAELALTSVAAEKFPGYDEHQSSVVLEPSYGQLDYYAPVLLALAREYRRPIYQHLALWDHSLGSIQRTRYVTPHGEQLLFELGGYAFLWCDESVPARSTEKKLSWHFPSVDEAYARASWKPNDLLVGVRKGELLVHAGGYPVFIEIGPAAPSALQVQTLEDNGRLATIRCAGTNQNTISVELNRHQHRLLIRRQVASDWQFWCQGEPKRSGKSLIWKTGAQLTVQTGTLAVWEPNGFQPKMSVGNGLLDLADPSPMKYPRCVVRPAEEREIVIEVRLQKK